jgi:N-methylhydantoinase B
LTTSAQTNRADSITVAVVKGALGQIADEMDAVIVRAAFSQVISEVKDRASGIFDAQTGEIIALGSEALAIFISTMQFAVQSVIEESGQRGGFSKGDIYLLNSPYPGGSHLPDMKLVMPLFDGDRVIAILAVCGHWNDVGGIAPGGFAPMATEVFQEGIQIRPVPLYKAGAYQEDLIRLVLDNVRLPQERYGDLQALLAALRVGEERFNTLKARYGAARLEACFDELNTRSDAGMRALIRSIPDGEYSFEDAVDNDGHIDQPLRIRCKLTVAGDTITADFTGSSGPARGPVNIPRGTTIAAVQIALKHVFTDIEVNGGCFRPVSYIIPENCFLAARSPQPTSGYPETAGRVYSVVSGALSKALPSRVPADWFGVAGIITVAGHNPVTGSQYITMFVSAGGYGGHPTRGDGLVNGAMPLGMANYPSVESTEHRAALLMETLAIRDGSGGAGRARGGCGTAYRYRVLEDNTVVNALGDRHDFVPFGVAEGRPAEGSKLVFHTSSGATTLPMSTKGRYTAQRGDVIEYLSPGGGGYGNPFDRDPTDVLQDVVLGYVSADQAQRDYGVVLHPASTPGAFVLSEQETRKLRAARSA